MLPSNLLVLLSAAVLTSASPIYHLRKRCNETTPDAPSPAPTTPPSTVTPVLPVNGGDTELAGPGNLTLKHIVVAHGIQNYTCASSGSPATSTGALAVFWDITSLYPGTGPTSLSESDWLALPATVLRTTDMPLNLAPTSSSQWAADPSAPFPSPAADLSGIQGVEGALKFMGHHFFDTTLTPTFDVQGAGDGGEAFFQGKKDGDIKAPADADRGLTDSGAVDWLRLTDKGTSEGEVSLVFRVLTAGGNPAACGEAGQTDSVPYAAMYWMY